MKDGDVCDNWEAFSEDNGELEKRLEKLRIHKGNELTPFEAGGQSSNQVRILSRHQQNIPFQESIKLDSTSEESMRTQPQFGFKILTRPTIPTTTTTTTTTMHNKQKSSSNPSSSSSTKTLQQREKEYNEARMRILGDVRFVEEEKEAELESKLSPAEILYMKVTQSMLTDDSSSPSPSSSIHKSSSKETSSKKISQKQQIHYQVPPIHFPPSKMDSKRIIRQPRGPDGTSGFHLQK